MILALLHDIFYHVTRYNERTLKQAPAEGPAAHLFQVSLSHGLCWFWPHSRDSTMTWHSIS